VTAGRTYLSIGDVLTLLRQEFPDVTISKIRFLESQGLVNPERTPSGYRKFYDHDVERLKWVLSQQREHFLPLKVIKGRLEDETAGEEGRHSRGGARVATATRPTSPVAGAVGNAAGNAVGGSRSIAAALSEREANGRTAGPGGGRTRAEAAQAVRGPRAIGLESRVGEVPGKLPGFDRDGEDTGDETRGTDDGARKVARPAGAAAVGRPGPAGSAGAGGTAGSSGTASRSGGKAAAGPGDQRVTSHPATSPQSRGLHAAGGVISDAELRRGAGRSTATVSVEQGRHVQGRTGRPSEVPVRAGASGASRSGAPSGRDASSDAGSDVSSEAGRDVGRAATSEPRGWLRSASRSLTAVELAAASGLSEPAVAELDSYGILSSKLIGGTAHYDESEVAVARLAAEFAQFGIEPRHLRLYKHSAEREAGFVEQLVLPLLRQRNPEARNRAGEMMGDLTRLGQGLREALVQRNLKDLLGG
jgi:DNA-binding transcriptional MerR regulator